MTQAPRDDVNAMPHQQGLTVGVLSPREEPPPNTPPPPVDTGLACVVMMARLHGVAADADQLAHEAAAGRCWDTTDVLLAAKRLQLQAKAVKVDVARLAKTPLPAMAVGRAEDGSADFFILARVDGDQVLIQSPRVGRPETLTLAALQARWRGELILFTSRASVAGELGKFDFTWFVPAIVKYRKLLLEVLLVSFVLQIFALITPLFFQVVMDKVLVHRGLTTLDVIAVGLAAVVVFEVALTALRSYVFAHTTSRMDVELGARLFRHLLAFMGSSSATRPMRRSALDGQSHQSQRGRPQCLPRHPQCNGPQQV